MHNNRLAPGVAAAVLLASSATAQNPAPLREFRIDASHSSVEFSVPFLGHAVRGRFDDLQGAIAYAPRLARDPGASAITVVIGAASINTGSKHRDEHLRSEDFFDVDRFPRITFRSEDIVRRDSTYVMRGSLSMHGVTKAITIPFRASGPPVDDPHGSQLVHFLGSVKLARKDFGILGGEKHNDWFDAVRSATMGDSVDVTLEIAGWRTDYLRTKQYDAALQRMATQGIDSALARVRKAVATSPSELSGIQYEVEQIAASLIDHSRVAEAVQLLKLDVELGPKSADAHAALARAYEAGGTRDLARAEAQAALAINAFHPRALEILRRL